MTEYKNSLQQELSTQGVTELSNTVSEFSARGMSEYFPAVTTQPLSKTRKARKKRQALMSKMLAATTVFGVGVVAVQGVASLPKMQYPAPTTVQVLAYQPSMFVSAPTDTDSTAGYYTTPAYTVGFPFTLYDGTAVRVEIQGTKTTAPLPYVAEIEESPVFCTIDASELEQTENGVLASYLIEDMEYDYTLTATLYYTVENPKTEKIEEKSVQTQPFLAGQSYFITQETQSMNQVELKVVGETVQATAIFREVRIGAFELRGENIEVEYVDTVSGDILDYFEREVELVATKQGTFVYAFEIPLPAATGIHMRVGLQGDSYFNGQKMECTSFTYAEGELLF